QASRLHPLRVGPSSAMPRRVSQGPRGRPEDGADPGGGGPSDLGSGVPLREGRQAVSMGAAPPLQVPNLGRYEVVAELGRGAMGVVYKARDPMLERTVAIKTINMALEEDGAAHYEERFQQEARAAGSLNHPNIVTIHDIGKSAHIAYMAMEYIEGVELR